MELTEDDVGTIGPNAGLLTDLGLTVTFGATVARLSDGVGGACGLNVTTGGPGLPLSVDLKTNSVLECGFTDGFFASAVAAIKAAFAMALAAAFSSLPPVFGEGFWVCGL